MAKSDLLGLGIAGTALVVLVGILVLVPYLKKMFPGYIQGFATYDCSRDVTCPEGSFCQSNTCIPIRPPNMNGNVAGYYS
jgi:hypothetical protein